jgi:tripartite-type tricarboxylate transporter receptor subunit TctC
MFKHITCVFATSLALAFPVQAQQVNIPPLIRIIVPFGAGASTDIIARAVAAQLGPRLGTTVVVENRPGGSSLIGAGAVAKSPKDGSMLLLTTPSTVTATATIPAAPVDLNNDLTPVSMLMEGPMVITVPAQSSIRTPANLVAAARAKPDTLTYGTSGIGTLAHMAFELVNDAAKIQLKHIPYKGAAFALTDLLAGTIDLSLGAHSTFASQIKAGRIRAIAVTSAQPSPAFPELPTMASAAPGFSVDIWAVVFAPAGTPAALVQRLNSELGEIAKSKELQEIMKADGQRATSYSPAELQSLMRSSVDKWKKLAADKKISID